MAWQGRAWHGPARPGEAAMVRTTIVFWIQLVYDMDMNIVAFDPSLVSTGVWIDAKAQSTVIKTDAKANRIQRLAAIHSQVTSILRDARPDLVVVENYAFQVRNSKAITVQAEVGGIIRSVAHLMGAYVVEVSAMQWKSAVMGKDMIRAKKGTKMEKSLYLGYVESQSGIRFATCDEADAFMIAEYVKDVLNGGAPQTDAAKRLKKHLEDMNIGDIA
jgi:Holliday junction resolvasome RuvABC endonuclease subunit